MARRKHDDGAAVAPPAAEPVALADEKITDGQSLPGDEESATGPVTPPPKRATARTASTTTAAASVPTSRNTPQADRPGRAVRASSSNLADAITSLVESSGATT